MRAAGGGGPRRRAPALARAIVALGLLGQITACAPPAPQLGSQSSGYGAGTMGRPSLVAFETSPFPYRGDIPDKGTPFLNVSDNGRLGHAAPRGGTYWEDQTYSDRRTLLYIPNGFDPRRPATMIVFFHGNNATLERDVINRQGVPRQVADSGLNAVLVAPQFAFDARDSSAGRFWEPGVFRQFLREAADHLAEMAGNSGLQRTFDSMPVVLVAYSGGYTPAAAALDVGGAGGRISGVVLFDALYGETGKFAEWITNRGSGFFFSAYGASTRSENLTLQQMLSARGVVFGTGLSSGISQSSVTFLDAGDGVEHNDFLTRAWTGSPLQHVLAKLRTPEG